MAYEKLGVRPPPELREPIKRPQDTDRKLLYLDRLNDLLVLDLPYGVRADIAGRVQKVCVSIEADLNLGKDNAE